MAELDAKTEGTLRSFTREMRDLYGEDLISVILYGSAVGPDYIPEVSDLNLLVILGEVGPEQLEKGLKYVKRWRKSRINPLFLDLPYIESSVDAFPIEFLEMKEHHRLLWGEDPLEELEVSQENLRLQCEQELKGKWLKLRQIYLETEGAPKRLRQLMVASLRPFGVVLSALLRLKGFPVPPREFLEVLTQVEETLGLELAAFREAHQLKLGGRSLSRDALNALFAQYLQEIRWLVQAADGLFKAEG
jgi:predicted nucleotidyltransferase